jgi:tryptophan synthase alpha chain
MKLTKENHMSGVERIRSAFDRANTAGRAAFMPYHALGYPNRNQALEIVAGLAKSGADLFELGIPFSDPLADGPTIQTATHKALIQGTTVTDCLAMAKELRAQGVHQPFCAMSYYNPILTYGEERFVADAVTAGIDGLIVPDLPPEEAESLEAACREVGLAMVYLLAPTSTEARIRLIAARATGFIYLVSVTGITGARQELPSDLLTFVRRVRQHTDLPLAVGFGISTPEQAAQVAQIADGVIVGSALVRLAEAPGGVDAICALASELARGCSAAATGGR